jgi:hypothetical protein
VMHASNSCSLRRAFLESDLVVLATNVIVVGNSDYTDFPSTCCAVLFCDRNHLHKIENRSTGQMQEISINSSLNS